MDNNAEHIRPAAFSLHSYKVIEFSFNEPTSENHKLGINLSPTGIYYPKQKRFSLLFDFAAVYAENDVDIPILSIKTTAEFTFEEEATLETLPPYFFSNSIAIVFPFVRAFVATLTTIANVKQIILPILNLTSMQDILKNNTTVDESEGFPFNVKNK